MIRYLKNAQIDKPSWDQCIDHAANGIVYAYSWYLDVVSPGWDALVMNEYDAVMPVTRGRKYLMDYLYPPPFVQQLGIFSNVLPDEALTSFFFKHLPEAFRFVEMNLHISNQWIPEGYSGKSMRDQILDLARPLSQIRAGYHTNHVRNIKKAKLAGLSVFPHGTIGQVIEMFRLNKGRFIPGMRTSHYAMLEMLTAEAVRRGKARIWLVRDRDGVPCAGALFMESHRTGIFLFSATTGMGKSLSAMHFLVDAYVEDRCTVLTALDFEGSNDSDLSRFYRGFGSTDCVYLQIKQNKLPYPWKLFKN